MYRNSEGYRDPVAGKALYLSKQPSRQSVKPKPAKKEQAELNYFAEPAYTNPNPVRRPVKRKNNRISRNRSGGGEGA